MVSSLLVHAFLQQHPSGGFGGETILISTNMVEPQGRSKIATPHICSSGFTRKRRLPDAPSTLFPPKGGTTNRLMADSWVEPGTTKDKLVQIAFDLIEDNGYGSVSESP
jgi:hypothetical protein